MNVFRRKGFWRALLLGVGFCLLMLRYGEGVKIRLNNLTDKFYVRYCLPNVVLADDNDGWYVSKDLILVIHGGGAGEHLYGNCKEHIRKSMELGFPVVEVDVVYTSDKRPVLSHVFRPEDETVWDHVPTYDEFKSVSVNGSCTPLSLREFLGEFDFTKSPYIFLDSKRDLKDDTDYCLDIVKIVREMAAENEHKFVIQIHNYQDIDLIMKFGWKGSVHYCLGDEDPTDVAKICAAKGVHSISISEKRILRSQDIKVFLDHGIHVFAYTVNHRRRMNALRRLGVSGIFTDRLLPE